MRASASPSYVRATSFAAALDGTGAFSATGQAESLDVRLSGTGAAELGGLSSAAARVLLSGTGDVHVTATRSLDARVSGTGNVLYSGNPATVRQSVVGTGSIIGS